MGIWCCNFTWFLRICKTPVSCCAVFAITFHAAFILWSQSDVSKHKAKEWKLVFPPMWLSYKVSPACPKPWADLQEWASYCNTTKYYLLFNIVSPCYSVLQVTIAEDIYQHCNTLKEEPRISFTYQQWETASLSNLWDWYIHGPSNYRLKYK